VDSGAIAMTDSIQILPRIVTAQEGATYTLCAIQYRKDGNIGLSPNQMDKPLCMDIANQALARMNGASNLRAMDMRTRQEQWALVQAAVLLDKWGREDHQNYLEDFLSR
jgi:hypothetical protein